MGKAREIFLFRNKNIKIKKKPTTTWLLLVISRWNNKKLNKFGRENKDNG